MIQMSLISVASALKLRKNMEIQDFKLSLDALRSSSPEATPAGLARIAHLIPKLSSSFLQQELAREVLGKESHNKSTEVPHYIMKITEDDGMCWRSTSALYLLLCVLRTAPLYVPDNPPVPFYFGFPPVRGPDCSQMGYNVQQNGVPRDGSCVQEVTMVGTQNCLSKQGQFDVANCYGPSLAGAPPTADCRIPAATVNRFAKNIAAYSSQFGALCTNLPVDQRIMANNKLAFPVWEDADMR